ncbi:hypothetical protein Q3G72_028354 [Acer saccharum]|nr:hypothetical protein Q3G72_028354 [Acer saccharum]
MTWQNLINAGGVAAASSRVNCGVAAASSRVNCKTLGPWCPFLTKIKQLPGAMVMCRWGPGSGSPSPP